MSAIDSRNPEAGSAREHAFRILTRVDSGGAYGSVLLERLPGRRIDPRELRLATELVYGTLRWRARLDHCLERLCRRAVETLPPGLRTALRLASYQILFLDRIPDAAAVSTSVDLARRAGGAGWARFANGVLRNLCRKRGDFPLPPEDSAAPADLALRHSHPIWMVERWIASRGLAAARELMASNNRPAPTVLRVQRPGTGRDLASRLAGQGVETEPSPILPDALRVVRGNPFRTAAYREGLFYAQDEASQLVGLLFGEEWSGPLLDLCAAPGGKALQIASRDRGRTEVIAADRNAGRIRRLEANRRRLKVDNLHSLVADFRTGSPFGTRFPRVLLDAPCTGTGTLRRHPEIRWRLRPSDLTRLSRVQEELLAAAALHLAPEGILVYSVCSLEPEEGRERVGAFLESHPDFRLGDAGGTIPEPVRPLATEGPFLSTVPYRGGMDGFFAARLQRRRS